MREILPLAIGELKFGPGRKSRGKLEQKEGESRKCRSLGSPNVFGDEGKSSWSVIVPRRKAKFELSLPHVVQVEP
jgi:hypothetical protein